VFSTGNFKPATGNCPNWRFVLAKTVKGVRINALAKELNVDSKAILEKLRAEGMGDAAPNHMSTVPLGLAETIKEWFHAIGAGVGTAVEMAAPVDVMTAKPRTARKRSMTRSEGGDHSSNGDEGGNTAVAEMDSDHVDSISGTISGTILLPPEMEPVDAETHRSSVATPEPVVDETIAEAPPAPKLKLEPTVVPASAPKRAAPAVAEQPSVNVIAPAITAPAAPAAHGTPAPAHSTGPTRGAAHHGTHGHRGHGGGPPPVRPTVTLANRGGIASPERKPVVVAQQLSALKPAQIQGPRIVRIEKPEALAPPRPRRPLGPNEPPPQFSTAKLKTGAGVRKTDEEEEAEKKSNANKKAAASLSARRRGVDGRRGEAVEKLKEFTEADRYEREEKLRAATASRANVTSHLTKTQARGTHAFAKTTIEKGEPITIEEPITVKSLSAVLGVKSNDLMGKLMKQGVFATINQSIDVEIAKGMATAYGLELQIARQETMEEMLVKEFDSREQDTTKLMPRPPVVTILGHVDHGKTSLLDKIRSANVAAGEAGGITQHTAAWMVSLGEGDKQRKVTFIDTPGHQAFTAMRARGANMTDVVVLVIGAVEGVMPQTVESINHARAADVPIVVALSKSDRADANPDMVLGQLAQQELNPVEWGGQTEVIRTSAVTGNGINELIEILDLQSELLELKYDPTAPARGSVIEARIDPGMGPVATVLVQDGTLKVGDVVLAGGGYGRIRSILNDRGQSLQEATASMPVVISGLASVPSAGDQFFAVEDLDRAREIASERSTSNRQGQLAVQNRVTSNNLLEQIAATDVKTINLIIKADVQGSIETLVATVGGQNTAEVKVKVVHSGVGAISESDVQLAMATKAKPTDNRVSIIGFHVVPDESARQLAEQNHVEIKLYRVIYEIFDDLKKALSGMLTKEVREKLHGHAEIRQVFKSSKLGSIAGCMVTDGHVQRGSKARLIRDGRVITEDLTLDSLKRVKEDAREVKTGFECGIKLAGYDDIKQGDRLEFYIREEFERTL